MQRHRRYTSVYRWRWTIALVVAMGVVISPLVCVTVLVTSVGMAMARVLCSAYGRSYPVRWDTAEG